ncbi:MAG: hypothetical protein AAFZ65_04990 [Planctomycetota bacterium]
MRALMPWTVLLAAMVGCQSPPQTAFDLTAAPDGAEYRTSWGERGVLPATLEPPLEVGRQWFIVSAEGHHSQEVRFNYRDRNVPDPSEAYDLPLTGLDTTFTPQERASDLDRDLSLEFQRVHVILLPLAEIPPFVVDLDGGYSISRVQVD